MPAGEDLKGFQIIGGNMSVSQAISIGAGSIFHAHEEQTHLAFIFDAMAYMEKPRVDHQSIPGFNLITYQGCGLRIAFKYEKIAGGLNLNFAQLGVAAKAQLARVEYQVDAPGLGAGALGAILESIPSSGPLDDKTYGAMVKRLISRLAAYLNDPATAVTIVPIRTLSKINAADEIEITKAVLFGMKMILRCLSFSQALTQPAAGKYNRDLIKYAYRIALPNKNDSEPPADEDVARAKAWLRSA